MRSPTLAVLLAGGLCAPAAGQLPEPVPVPIELLPTRPPGSPPTVYAADPLFAPPPVEAPPDPTRWRADVVAGLPIALRLQRQIGDARAWVEGGVGLYVIVPSVFVGLRADSDLHVGRRHAVFARPGVDFYYSPIYSRGGFLFGDINGIYVLSADADLLWRCRWTSRVHGLLGTKVGCGVGYAGNGSVFPVPILGLTIGLQF